jgi:hypothetical protein
VQHAKNLKTALVVRGTRNRTIFSVARVTKNVATELGISLQGSDDDTEAVLKPPLVQVLTKLGNVHEANVILPEIITFAG